MSEKPRATSKQKEDRHKPKPKLISQGEQFKQSRVALGVTQGTAAKWLGISQRKLSYFENGRSELTKEELNLAETHFDRLKRGDFLWDVPSLNLLPEPQFIMIQQSIIKNSAWKDFWFFGIQKLPVLTQASYEETWADNLANGINYRLFWVLQDHNPGLYKNVQNAFSRVADLVKKKNKSPHGSIFLYGIAIGNINDPAVQAFAAIGKHFKEHFPNTVKPSSLLDFSLARFEKCRSILQYGWQSSVVLYVDKSGAKTFAATFLENVSNDPKGGEKGWTFFNPDATGVLESITDAFQLIVPDNLQ